MSRYWASVETDKGLIHPFLEITLKNTRICIENFQDAEAVVRYQLEARGFEVKRYFNGRFMWETEEGDIEVQYPLCQHTIEWEE